MTVDIQKSAPPRIAPTGFLFLGIMSLGAGINWPVQKLLLSEWPPMSARGLSGFAGALVLAALAVALRQTLRVPNGMWPRIVISALLNITSWVLMMGYALTILPASEAAIIAYTMPVWTALLAWPVLGERLTLMRVVALLMAFAGIAALMGGNSIEASLVKLPGLILALITAVTYALGTIFLKRFPIAMPPVASAAWQLGIGCAPVAVLGLAIERPEIAALTIVGWLALAYNTTVQQCIGFVCWLAALQRLPASVAAIGTMFVPIIGVIASAYALNEPLGAAQIAALVFTIGSVVLAVRS
ncbi:DMT transporter permease [Afipia sp. P52-10]|uniref:DMT family transporter n=1 Tax=Afipia sp. P52-10 TaxID=1429916 RepID=UPI0003DF0589|nr:DMT family transporter [Afipia sp. P52-10]ETR74969.1 DMT transporter permease [Afipia sp. P52-10]